MQWRARLAQHHALVCCDMCQLLRHALIGTCHWRPGSLAALSAVLKALLLTALVVHPVRHCLHHVWEHCSIAFVGGREGKQLGHGRQQRLGNPVGHGWDCRMRPNGEK